MKLLLTAMLFAATSAGAAAQVGYPPNESPYHDLSYKQQVSLFGGWFAGAKGAAGVGPKAGPLFGVRYDLHLGGPADFVVRLARASSTRDVIDPTQPPATRAVGSRSLGLYLADVGITMALTGQKSYRRLVPVVGFGLGIASAGGATRDSSGYRFGSPFAISGTAGLRYVPGSNVSVRLDFTDYLFQLSYPNSFLVAPTGTPPVLSLSQGTNQWTHNLALTLGVSYVFSR